MITTELTIVNKLGLHARAATKLAQTSGRFASTIRCGHSGKMVDAKSVMAVMLLAASKGTQLTFEVDGNDEQEAMDTIAELIAGFFGEGQ
ncbi:HPr family phosphocarrier protein [Porticoccus sp. W117]|uniref:HPr family phosphocarrier protein n=1 Tax=Porticoccus sp. W117 TaxID=3054777 RepID=UPI002596FAE1|nr:HPr family phosphocarrier protein [Porticoccus sp. W117]MDM3871283.1 HPr family phosphocarrier protein [Porticoccus sp. W117]